MAHVVRQADAGTDPWDPQEERIRRAWLALLIALGTLALAALLDLVVAGASVTNLLVIALVIVASLAATSHRRELASLERRRRADAEGFARMLRAMSRSVSPEAIVESIVHELGATVAADHLVVVHLRQGGELLDATLFTASGNAPVASTVIPFDGEGSDESDRRVQSTRVSATEMLAADDRLGTAVGIDGTAVIAVGPGHDGALAAGLRAGQQAVREAGGRGRGGRTRGRAAEPPVSRIVAGSVADRVAARVASAFGLKNTIAAPLVTPTGVVGAIVVSRRTAEPWSVNAKRLVSGAAVEASAALVRAYSHRAAEAEAATDALTRLPNRRYFEEVCSLWARRRRGDRSVGIVMVDIDRFKTLNDTFGHGVGDEVLREVGQAIARAVREDDVPARYGGEEFIVLLRDPGPGIAEAVGERIRLAVRGLDLSDLGVGTVTVSVGVAVDEPGTAEEVGGSGTAGEASPAGPEPIAALIERADRALYEAKDAGRDRVVASVPERAAR